MDDRLKQLKDGLNSYFTNENKFTDAQKRKIRAAIQKERNRTINQRFIMSKGFAAFTVACALVLIVIGVAINNPNNIGFNSSESQIQESNDSIDQSSDHKELEIAEIAPDSSEDRAIEEDEHHEVERITIENSILPLNEELLEIYQHFSTTYSEDLLRGLEPYIILKLYFHAEMKKDFDTQAHFQHDVPSKKSNVDEHTKDNYLHELEKTMTITQVKTGRDSANVQLTSHTTNTVYTYEFFKNKNGIWTVK